jgi:hypothetical protein
MADHHRLAIITKWNLGLLWLIAGIFAGSWF